MFTDLHRTLRLQKARLELVNLSTDLIDEAIAIATKLENELGDIVSIPLLEIDEILNAANQNKE